MLQSRRVGFTTAVVLASLLAFALFCNRWPAYAAESLAYYPDVKDDTGPWTGRLERVKGPVALLTVRGSPQERGTAHGKLLEAEVRGLVRSVKAYLLPRPDDAEGKAKY